MDDIRRVARQFAAKGVALDRCFVSPYIRAGQSATEFLRELRSDLRQEPQLLLTPDVHAINVLRFLQSLPDAHVLLVSHNPLLSELAALLTEGAIDDLHILRTAELVCVALTSVGLGTGVTAYRLLPTMPGEQTQHD
jgi:phosphohistidine phosphatase